MYRVALTGALPPHTSRLPLIFPESRLKGATPTKDERRLWVMVPSSGSSAKSVLASTGPTPGTLLSSCSLRRQTSLCWTASWSSRSVRSSSFSSQRMWAAPGQDRLQSLGFLIRQYARRGFDGRRETGEDLGVDLVGLGQAPGGLGEIPGLPRVEHSHGDPGGGDGRGGRTLVTTGGFQDDQLGALFEESLDQRVDALGIVVDGEGLALGQEVNVQTLLGDVYPRVGGGVEFVGGARHGASPSPCSFSCCACSRGRPDLADTGSPAKLAAPATVRAPPEGGREDSCFLTVLRRSSDQGGIGLSRPLWPHCERPKSIYKEDHCAPKRLESEPAPQFMESVSRPRCARGQNCYHVRKLNS